MKKLNIILFLLFSLALHNCTENSSQSDTTDETAEESTTGEETTSDQTTTIEEESTTDDQMTTDSEAEVSIDDIKAFFDVMYLPSNGYQDLEGTAPVADDQSIRYFKDEIGDRDMVYNGNPTPTRIGEPPHYFSDEGGYVFLPNVNNIHWETPGQFEEIPQPFDVYYVFRDLQGILGENYVKGSNTFNLRDRRDQLAIGLGVGNSSVELPAGTTTLKEDFQNVMSIIRIRFDGAASFVVINRDTIKDTNGEVAFVDIGDGGIFDMAMGTQNNCSHSDFFFAAAKFGKLTVEENERVYETLEELYPPNEFPMKPFAKDVTVDFDGDTWTVDYEFVNRLGFTEDVSRTEFIWYHAGSASSRDLSNQLVIPGATGRTLNRLDHPEVFPDPPSFVWIRPAVKVYDTEGNTWRFLDALWLRDNID